MGQRASSGLSATLEPPHVSDTRPSKRRRALIHLLTAPPTNPVSSASDPTLPVAAPPAPAEAAPVGTSDSEDSLPEPASGRIPSPAPDPPDTRTAAGRVPPISRGFRAWAPVDDNELIQYKQDTRARPILKRIGQRLHRDPQSCKARWQWLKSTPSDLASTPTEARADGD
eukprot:s1820_g16.t1